jgi:hypothetical protein
VALSRKDAGVGGQSFPNGERTIVAETRGQPSRQESATTADKTRIPLDKARRGSYPKKLSTSSSILPLQINNCLPRRTCQIPSKPTLSLSGIPEAPASADEVAVHTRVSRDRPPGLTWLQLHNRHAFAKGRCVMEGSTIQAASD